METWLGGFEFVKVTCFDLHHGVHDVSAVDFVLLELAEGALGSSEQKVLSLRVFSVTGALASALRSRMRRQEGKADQEDQLYTACRIQYHLTEKETHFFIPHI